MIIDIFNEIPWQSFQNLEFIKKLPLNEQKEKYDKYISELSLAKDFQLQYQVKGPRTGENPLACTSGMDVIFCIDYSGSMGTAINNIKISIASIVATIKSESLGDYRLGLVIFDEYRFNPRGTDPGTPQDINYAEDPLVPVFTSGTSAGNYGGDLGAGPNIWNSLPAAQKVVTTRSTNPSVPLTGVFQVLTAMEVMSDTNETSFTTQLNLLNTTNFPIGGGGLAQRPEPGDLAIQEIIDNNFAGTFRNNVAKVIITISDNYPGGFTANYSEVSVSPNPVIDRLEALKTTSIAQNIQHLAMIDLDTGIPDPDPMQPNTGYRILTDNTDGEFVSSFTPTNIITAIENLCDNNA